MFHRHNNKEGGGKKKKRKQELFFLCFSPKELLIEIGEKRTHIQLGPFHFSLVNRRWKQQSKERVSQQRGEEQQQQQQKKRSSKRRNSVKKAQTPHLYYPLSSFFFFLRHLFRPLQYKADTKQNKKTGTCTFIGKKQTNKEALLVTSKPHNDKSTHTHTHTQTEL